MAAKILDDILSNFLPKETVFEWLSNKNSSDEENIFLNHYECSQVDFVSYFLIFLREQSSRDFQIYDAETPRKNSHSRIIKSASPTIGKSSPPVRNQQNSSLSGTNLDLESLQSFPTLSSCSSNIESCEKKCSETPSDSMPESGNKDNSERKFRRLKLFSEAIDKNSKGNNSSNKDIEFIEDVEQETENKFAMSTPKPLKNNSLQLIDCFNSSDLPVDLSPRFGSKPKWKNHRISSSPEINSITPKSKSNSGDSSHKSKNKFNCRLSLGDFILSDSNDNKKEKKNKTKKRINPVKVTSLSLISMNSSHSEKTDESLDNSCTENGISRIESVNKFKEGSEKQAEVKDTTPIKHTEGQAEEELVTHTSELQLLSEIYSFLMNENYCQNIMIELCFVISLLVMQDYNKKISDESDCRGVHLVKEKKLFGSIHNCVYFAVETLWLQRHYLQLLNLSALKLLSENVRIEKFNSKLKEFLTNAYTKRQSNDEIKKRQGGLMKTAMQGNVSFQYETDNRENFTSDASFHSFRKQRDLFYNILATWEANHLVTGWIFSIGLGSKIRSLLSTSSDPINLLHLSRLFRNQLIMSCCGENQADGSINEDILQLIPSADPNKILRLRARLTSSPKRQGPCPLPDFTGHQEFYKDFILCTSHSTFQEHLKNSLCDEILRLNDTELTGDVEDDDSCLDEQTQERYLQYTNILRLLAKFLGFVEFLPYRGEKPASDRILNIHCSVRNSTLPLFDVMSCLNLAAKKQKLTLTIPWLVSYLSMIDSYSAHLKFYQNVWRSLILIYKHLKTFKYAKTDFYLKLILGWIFQLPNFPSDLFYSVLDDFNKNANEVVSPFGGETKGLDSYDFLEETVLYTVCPFLNEINVILTEKLGCTVKHVRPVTTQENSFSKSQASKQIELRLESNFLHNQSSSTRKTIEFVTERVASVVIKHLIHNIVPKIKEDAWTQLESSSATNLKEADAECEILAEKCYKEIQKACEKENWDISCKRSDVAIKALLSNDLQGSVADTCAKIAARQATEKVQRWMQSHITVAVVKKEFLSTVKKKLTRKLPDSNGSTLDGSEVLVNSLKNCHPTPSVRRGTHDETIPPPSEILKAVRELIWKTYEKESDAVEVGEMIERTISTIQLRRDVIPAAEKIFSRLLVDLIVIFCVHSENDVPQEIFKKFFHFFKSIERQNLSHSSLERIICPRNVAIVRTNARSKEKAWQNLGNFLMCLMEEDLLTREQIETQLLSLLRLDWEREDAVQYSKFISQILEKYTKGNGCDKFSLLLEYMIDTLNDEDPKSESLG